MVGSWTLSPKRMENDYSIAEWRRGAGVMAPDAGNCLQWRVDNRASEARLASLVGTRTVRPRYFDFLLREGRGGEGSLFGVPAARLYVFATIKSRRLGRRRA